MKPRVLWTNFALMIIFGSFEFMQASRSPRFEMMHTIDIVQLMVSGVCLGVAMASLAIIIRGSRKSQS